MSENTTITDGDIDRFLAKLGEWGTGLDATDQAILHIVLSAANEGCSEPTDVAGFAAPGTSLVSALAPNPLGSMQILSYMSRQQAPAAGFSTVVRLTGNSDESI